MRSSLKRPLPLSKRNIFVSEQFFRGDRIDVGNSSPLTPPVPNIASDFALSPRRSRPVTAPLLRELAAQPR